MDNRGNVIEREALGKSPYLTVPNGKLKGATRWEVKKTVSKEEANIGEETREVCGK